MTKSVEELLKSFEQLPAAEKRELASEIIKRSLRLDLPESATNHYSQPLTRSSSN